MRTERDAWSANGLLTIALLALLIYLIIINIYEAEFVFAFLFISLIIILLAGLTIVKPNEAKVIMLFGKYLGTVRNEGLIYTVPFTKRKRISLKIKTFESEFSISLSDRFVTIHLILFYKVVDTAKVLFEVEQAEQFIQLQSETILKSILMNEEHENPQAELISDHIKEQFTILLEQKLNRLGIEIADLYIGH